jgi:hypothetical protein
MSYQSQIEEMVGNHVAEFQMELTMAKFAESLPTANPPMPNGYPIAVYYPQHIYKTPQVKNFIARTGGKLSNGVPRALWNLLVADYPLGIYNHNGCVPSP